MKRIIKIIDMDGNETKITCTKWKAHFRWTDENGNEDSMPMDSGTGTLFLPKIQEEERPNNH